MPRSKPSRMTYIATAMPMMPAQITGRYHSMAVLPSALRASASRRGAGARRAAGGSPRARSTRAARGPLRDQPVDVVDAHREHDAVDQDEQHERVATLRAGTGEIASAVRRMPCTIQGWRPLSVTTQPAMTATKPIHQVCADDPQVPAGLEQRAAPPQQRAVERRRDHEEADRQHDAEGEEHRHDRRTVLRRHALEPREQAVRVMGEDERGAARDRDFEQVAFRPSRPARRRCGSRRAWCRPNAPPSRRS